MQIALSDISAFSIIPSFVITIIKFPKAGITKPFLIFIICSCFVEYGSTLLGRYNLNNYWLFNIGILLQFYLLVWQLIFWQFLKSRSWYVKHTLILFTVIWVIETVVQDNKVLSNYSLTFSSIVLIIFFTAYINKLIFEDINNVLKDARFLISIGLLIYFSVAIVVFIFTSETLNFTKEFESKIWQINNLVNIVANIIFAIALLCIPKK